MQTPIIWGEPETSYIRRFMDGVDKVVTDEMQTGRSLLEESLTFVLARPLCWFNRPRLNRNIRTHGRQYVLIEFAIQGNIQSRT